MNQNYKYKPFRYFALTLALTWIAWIVAAILSYQKGGEEIFIITMIPGLLAPTLLTIIFIFTSKNNKLKKDFVQRLIQFKRI